MKSYKLTPIRDKMFMKRNRRGTTHRRRSDENATKLSHFYCQRECWTQFRRWHNVYAHTHIRFQFCNQKMSHAILRADRERKISDIYLHLSLGGVGTFGRRIPLHRKYLIYLQRSSIARNNFPADKVFSWWVRTSNVLCNVRAMAHRRRWFLLGSGKYSRMRIVCKCYATLNGRLETAKNKKMRSNGCRAIYRNLNVVVICNSRK